MTGMRGASLQTERGAGGITPPPTGAVSREAWPVAEPLGCVSPSGKNRGGTPEGVRALKARAAARKAAEVTEQRLTAFRFLFLFFRFLRSPD
jgi:hypothetical protein